MFAILVCAAVLAVAAGVLFVLRNRGGDEGFTPDRETYPIAGIDISAHNGDIDFNKVAADSVEFVYIKATEGTDFCDSRFTDNLKRARKAGLKAGPYHFFRFRSSGSEQARHMLATVGDLPTDLPWAIDVEHWQNDEDYDRSDVIRQLRGMVEVLRAEGKPVMIYTNKNGFGHFIAGNFADVPLWLCAKHPEPPAHSWAIWQYSHTGRVNGVSGDVDLNVFCSDTAEWDLFLRSRPLQEAGTK